MDDYIIVRSLEARHLEELVNAKILEGYKPQGGVVVGSDSAHRCIYCQAMVL
jgi:hypothetical protein